MLSDKAYRGSVFELKEHPLSKLLVLVYLLCTEPQRKTLRDSEVMGKHRIEHRPQLGEMVRLRRQLHVRHLRMLMVMCMRGPKLKSRLQKVFTDKPPVSSAYFKATIGVQRLLVRFLKRGLSDSMTFLVHWKNKKQRKFWVILQDDLYFISISEYKNVYSFSIFTQIESNMSSKLIPLLQLCPLVSGPQLQIYLWTMAGKHL